MNQGHNSRRPLVVGRGGLECDRELFRLPWWQMVRSTTGLPMIWKEEGYTMKGINMNIRNGTSEKYL